MSDNTVKHAGWMPGNPSMDVSGSLTPDFEGNTAPTPGGEGSVSTHIMETIEGAEFPGSGQGNLEPMKGSGVKGA